MNNHYHFLWGWIRTGLIWFFAKTGKLTCFNSLKWDPAMADSHYMQMMEGFFLYYLFVTTGGHGVKVILRTMKDWLWMTASTSGLHIARFRRRFGQWNALFTELCAQNLLAALAWRNSCYCFCGMKNLDANQLWQEVEDRAVTALDRSFSVRTLGWLPIMTVSSKLMMKDWVIDHLKTAIILTLNLLWLSPFPAVKMYN